MPPFVYASADFGFWDALVALSLGDEHELHGPDASASQGTPPLSPTPAPASDDAPVPVE